MPNTGPHEAGESDAFSMDGKLGDKWKRCGRRGEQGQRYTVVLAAAGLGPAFCPSDSGFGACGVMSAKSLLWRRGDAAGVGSSTLHCPSAAEACSQTCALSRGGLNGECLSPWKLSGTCCGDRAGSLALRRGIHACLRLFFTYKRVSDAYGAKWGDGSLPSSPACPPQTAPGTPAEA